MATVATTAYSTITTINYYNNGGNDWKVGAKYGMDLVMTGVGLVPTPWTMGTALVYGVVTGGYQAITGRSIFNDANDLLNQHGYYIP